MASNKPSFVRKLPIIGQYKNDKDKKKHQNAYFADLHSNSGYIEHEPTVLGWIKEKGPTKRGTVEYITSTFPCLKWIPRYNLQWLLGDVIAGLTVGAVIVPKSMAYARLAQLPVQYGLYTSVFGAATYWLFGTSKDIAIGPVAVASIITAQIVADIRNEHPDKEFSAPALASAVAMLAGSLIAILGLLRLGWLVDLISLPAVAAFISGSSITVVLGQFPELVGIRHINSRDPAYKIFINILKNLNHMRIDAAFGVSALVLLYGLKYICGSVAKKRPALARKAFFISSMRAVTVIFLFTLISYGVNHNRKKDPLMHLIGFIPRGFSVNSTPRIEKDMLATMLGQVPVAAVVMLIEHISIAKEFGRSNGYNIKASSEFLAIGVANILGPLVGAFAATGSVSGTAINSKAGARTPLSGVFSALVVLIAIYTLTPAFFFVPTSALAAIITHAIGDLITPPSTLYEFWRISPLDVMIFLIGFMITLFVSIELGVYAMIALSLLVLLFRSFQTHGSFLGYSSLRTVETSKSPTPGSGSPVEDEVDSLKLNNHRTGLETERKVFLPLDRHDGSNPKIQLETPEPGIFIYRFKEGFNYTNCSKQLDEMSEYVTFATRRGQPPNFEKPGDRPWNDSSTDDSNDDLENNKPLLAAIILDFSTVDNVDLTSVQYLIDTRNVLDKHTAPFTVNWHFSCIHNAWSKRALAAAGFGYPSFETEDGRPQHFTSIYSLAETSQSTASQGRDDQQQIIDERKSTPTQRRSIITSVEPQRPDFVDEDEKMTVEHIEVTKNGKITKKQMENMEAIHGMNRPYFHPDIQSALLSAMASKLLQQSS